VTRPALLPALAAALVPSLAAAALARSADRGAEAEARRLAALPREARLAALEDALAGRARPAPPAAQTAAEAERPRLAALLRAGPAADGPGSPLLLRRLLLQARLGSP
jgi:hypothetical protein